MGMMDIRRKMLANAQAGTAQIMTATGNPVSFVTDMVRPLKGLVVPFIPAQDLHGYDYPWSAGGDKQKADMTADNIVVGKYIDNSGVEQTSLPNFHYSNYIPVKPNTPYTMKISQSVGYFSYMEYDSSKGFLKRTLYGSSSDPAGDTITITTGENTAFLLFGANIDTTNVTASKILALKWMLAEGSTALNWKPYENVCPITGWTGATVSQANKNLFPMPSLVNGLGTNTMTITGEVILPPGSYTAYVSRSDTNNDSVWSIRMSQNGGSYARMGSNLSATALFVGRTFTLTEATVCKYQFYSSASLPTTTQYGVTVVKSGETATEFIPYQGENIPVSWQDSAGDVLGGTATYIGDGTWTLQREWKKITMTGASGASALHSGRTFDGKAGATAYVMFYSQLYRDAYNTKYCVIGDVIEGVKCTHAIPCVYDTTAIASLTDAGKTAFTWSAVTGGTVRIQPRIAFPLDTEIDTLAKANAWLAEQYAAGTPVEYTVMLNIPETYTLTTEQLITLLGENNIWTDTNEDLTAQYWSHI